MIDEARGAGADITLDTYPYLPGCTTLASLLPSWAHSGGPSATLRRLEDPVVREKMRISVEITGSDGGHGLPVNWEVVQVGSYAYNTSVMLLFRSKLPSTLVSQEPHFGHHFSPEAPS